MDSFWWFSHRWKVSLTVVITPICDTHLECSFSKAILFCLWLLKGDIASVLPAVPDILHGIIQISPLIARVENSGVNLAYNLRALTLPPISGFPLFQFPLISRQSSLILCLPSAHNPSSLEVSLSPSPLFFLSSLSLSPPSFFDSLNHSLSVCGRSCLIPHFPTEL